MDKPDIFDRIMALRWLRPLRPFYEKFKEPLLYLFFGGLTTLLSIFLYWLFAHPLGLPPLIANVISWVIVAPVLDIVIYSEPANLVFTQGAVAALWNAISMGVIGSLLLFLYSKTRSGKGSLSKE